MIFTFGTGGDTNAAKKELYEALQYSGLVTEDMTFDEMCEVLAAEYPDIYKLYMTSANEGGFEAYAGSCYAYYDYVCFKPSITFGGSMVVTATQIYSGANYGEGVAISKLIDLSNYNKIIFDYECTSSSAHNENPIIFFITPTKQPLMKDIAIVKETLLNNNTSTRGKAEIDISSVKGEFYVGFSLRSMGNATIKISNMYME